MSRRFGARVNTPCSTGMKPVGQAHVGHAVEQGVHPDLDLGARQHRADTEVPPVDERQVVGRGPVGTVGTVVLSEDVELVGIVELRGSRFAAANMHVIVDPAGIVTPSISRSTLGWRMIMCTGGE